MSLQSSRAQPATRGSRLPCVMLYRSQAYSVTDKKMTVGRGLENSRERACFGNFGRNSSDSLPILSIKADIHAGALDPPSLAPLNERLADSSTVLNLSYR